MKVQLKPAGKTAITCLMLIFFFSSMSHAQIVSKAHGNRESKYDVKFYFLDLDIERASDTIRGNVLVRATSLVSNLDTFALELKSNLTVDSVRAALDAGAFQHATFSRNNYELNIILPFVAGTNQTVQVRVYYHGKPSLADGVCGSYTSGFFKESSCFAFLPTHKFSASPPYNSSSWWPCKQWLTDKADSSWFYITTASADYGASNGLLKGTVTNGSKKTYQWKSKYPIDFYLISFVVTSAAPGTSYWHPTGRTDSLMLIGYGVYDEVKTPLQTYSNLFGLYPFYDEKLGLANVDLAGGIENQTMIALGDSYGGFAPHEIAHMWWGDNVTCGSWKDVMLNEGFATWCESVYAEVNSGTPNATRMAHFTDNTTTSPVYGVSMDTTSVSGVFLNANLYYKKASMVINSLRFTINDDTVFFRGLRNYQTQFGGKSALATDLKAVMETTSGMDLTDFFNQWYYKGGAPTFNITWGQTGNQLFLRIHETTNLSTNPLYKTPVEIKVQRAQGDTTVRLMVTDSFADFNFYCPGTITGFVVSPNQWITNGTGTVTHDQTVATISFNRNDSELHLFPNPAARSFTIKGGTDVTELKIYNMLGMLEYMKERYSPGESIDVAGLAPGTYFVHVSDGKREEVIRLLIQR